jgi:hypothetical protein
MTTFYRKLTIISFFAVFSFLLHGPALSESIPFETIDKGDYSYYRGNDQDFSGAELVIRDWKTWAWFWAKHTGGIQPLLPLPKIDFRTEMVVVAILGYQTSGGGPSIEISSIGDNFWLLCISHKGCKSFRERKQNARSS